MPLTPDQQCRVDQYLAGAICKDEAIECLEWSGLTRQEAEAVLDKASGK